MNTLQNRNQTIDFLRNMTVLLLIPFHVSIIFSLFGNFHIRNQETIYITTLLAKLLHPWMIPLLIMLAGISMRHSMEHRSDLVFIKERLHRLLLPLLFGILVIIPPQVFFELKSQFNPGRIKAGYFSGSYLEFYTEFFQCCYPGGNLTYHHLWFLLYLFIYSLLMIPVFRILISRTLITSDFSHKDLLGLTLVLFFIEFFLRPFFPNWQNFVSDWANHAHYLFLLYFGFHVWFTKNPTAYFVRNKNILLFIAAFTGLGYAFFPEK